MPPVPEVNMKKIKVLFFLIAVAVPAAYLTFSCNSAVSDEFGTLILDFGGAAEQ